MKSMSEALEAIRSFLHPVPEFDPKLEAELRRREVEAEAKANNGFRVLREARQSYDKRPSDRPPPLDNLSRELEEADDLVRRALGDG